MAAAGQGTALGAEIAKFDRLAADWWDPKGPMRPLHAMNPARMGWIVPRIARAQGRAQGRDPAAARPLEGLRVLDVGCGAGLASEALARAGAAVTGLDAAGAALSAARAHAAAGGLPIDYREGRPEELLAAGEAGFDAVIALEVIEHVADREAFCRCLAGLVRPDGPVFVSTLNRTARSFAFAKLGAEYLLRLLPVGTHDWRMFVRPAELGAELRRAGLRVTDIAGLTMDPLTGRWGTSRDVGINYLVMAAA
ncbi:bifunctional 2-polyprenyl-6-hydroxyphenol methylase/3-demethylubiquinol 3-O-methyltransferase UbiG [Paracraurococcus lichenis]|uniref:Ubiquinone biosynthesis O-methyltransferase n=1 Tax=Paracraurococcus lichenis TaxID=3064888 RepID=A0ABT9E3H4_9PROT|nr:bifunctional 2-polyprenyl-6-hydroxyphenol methylase/3-demethylubiquinol 3-O-methyltransferase UbiG [Paracraurococcus sp. LOR1-02]MDO9710725.1 bifunctional 2-polyprenyl-6-hydroxyphenol methylase/3-demethylubiquinol 3-O-methyltransferase UbiG [Paracraurococcus sp. LOR1-02]